MKKGFSSMEEIKEYLEHIRPLVTKEQHRFLKKALGLGEQEGLCKEIKGLGKIDLSIAYEIEKLNKLDYKTLSSCSGIFIEHLYKETGYLSFLYDSQKVEKIKEAAVKAGLEYKKGETYFKPSFTVRLTARGDQQKLWQWKRFFKHLEENIKEKKVFCQRRR